MVAPTMGMKSAAEVWMFQAIAALPEVQALPGFAAEDKIWVGEAQEDAAYPYIVYQTVSPFRKDGPIGGAATHGSGSFQWKIYDGPGTSTSRIEPAAMAIEARLDGSRNETVDAYILTCASTGELPDEVTDDEEDYAVLGGEVEIYIARVL